VGLVGEEGLEKDELVALHVSFLRRIDAAYLHVPTLTLGISAVLHSSTVSLKHVLTYGDDWLDVG